MQIVSFTRNACKKHETVLRPPISRISILAKKLAESVNLISTIPASATCSKKGRKGPCSGYTFLIKFQRALLYSEHARYRQLYHRPGGRRLFIEKSGGPRCTGWSIIHTLFERQNRDRVWSEKWRQRMSGSVVEINSSTMEKILQYFGSLWKRMK